jgi:hypothetical protein
LGARAHPCQRPLSLDKLAFACDALMRFVGALDAILALAVAWKLLGHFENTSWHKPTNCRVDDNDISNFEFVGRHRCLAFSWADTAGSYPNSVDGAHATRRPDAPSHGRTLIQTSDYPASLRGLSIGSGIIYSRNGEDQRQLRAEEGEKP